MPCRLVKAGRGLLELRRLLGPSAQSGVLHLVIKQKHQASYLLFSGRSEGDWAPAHLFVLAQRILKPATVQ
jgi:hypothetical protein